MKYMSLISTTVLSTYLNLVFHKVLLKIKLLGQKNKWKVLYIILIFYVCWVLCKLIPYEMVCKDWKHILLQETFRECLKKRFVKGQRTWLSGSKVKQVEETWYFSKIWTHHLSLGFLCKNTQFFVQPGSAIVSCGCLIKKCLHSNKTGSINYSWAGTTKSV